MSLAKIGSLVAGLMFLAPVPKGLSLVAEEAPTTQPAATQAAPEKPQVQVVKPGKLSLDVQLEGTLQPVDAFEVRHRFKAFSGPLTVTAAAPHLAAVKKGDILLQCDTTQIKWSLEQAEGELAAARSALDKAQADLELGTQADALALRMQEDAVRNAEAGKKWWDEVDGPQMLLYADMQEKMARHNLEDQQDELDQLRKMYKSEDLTSATADIVIKRALRSEEIAKINLKNTQERTSKSKTHEYPISKQRVIDGVEQVRQQLASLKVTQSHSAIVRKNAVASARIAYEQAARKFNELKEDFEAFTMKAPADGIVLYGQMPEATWQGSEPLVLKTGEKVAPGSVVMRVFHPGKLRVEVPLSDVQAFMVEPGWKVRVTPASLPQVSYEAKAPAPVAAPRAQPPGLGFQLVIPLQNADGRLLPGMKANVKMEPPAMAEVLLVPLTAVSGNTVTVVGKDGKQEVRQVALGKTDGQSVEIRSGLAEGDQVLVQAKK